jgi:hypothetical protein
MLLIQGGLFRVMKHKQAKSRGSRKRKTTSKPTIQPGVRSVESMDISP